MTLSIAERAIRSAGIAVTAALMLSGCADNPTLFGNQPVTTSALPAPAKPAVDPACVALNAKIDGLRNEGTPDRVAAAAAGKTKTVSVKRASLAKVAELDAANAEFQQKCSTLQPARAPAQASLGGQQAVAMAKQAPQAAAQASAAVKVAKTTPKLPAQ